MSPGRKFRDEGVAVSRPDAALLVESLGSAAESFAPGDLAYLPLTSKVERPLQDRLAWSLHTKLPELVVSREWKRTDLAILDAQASTPLLLLEAKAMYTADLVGQQLADADDDYPTRMRHDIEKAQQLASEGNAQVFALGLATHPMDVPENWPNVIKYVPLVRSKLRQFGEAGVREMAADTMKRRLSPLGPVRSGSLHGGRAFGVEVAVDWWLVGPVVET